MMRSKYCGVYCGLYCGVWFIFREEYLGAGEHGFEPHDVWVGCLREQVQDLVGRGQLPLAPEKIGQRDLIEPLIRVFSRGLHQEFGSFRMTTCGGEDAREENVANVILIYDRANALFRMFDVPHMQCIHADLECIESCAVF